MDKRSNNGGKIILGMLKGKSVTTSVPSMAIRFNATAEEIEEIYSNEEEQSDHVNDSALPIEKSSELETSPRRSILPFGKRSTSIDINSTNAQDSSPPSDPWRFLSDIKGKITKSVEVKFTEYKSRAQEGDSSPKIMKPIVKDSKENSSLSDSEEASESSISKTCGIVSTTEGVEMSSDDNETPSSSEEDKVNNDNTQSFNSTSSTAMRQRFRVTNAKNESKEGTVGVDFLDNIQKITDGVAGPESQEIESGVDVLADLNVANFEVDSEKVLHIHHISGVDLRQAELRGEGQSETVFSPVGFVDLRSASRIEWSFSQVAHSFRGIFLTIFGLCLYFCIPFTLYVHGFIAGVLVASALWTLYIKFCTEPYVTATSAGSGTLFKLSRKSLRFPAASIPILPVSPIEEHKPLTKYEGWVNEYPEEYNPLTYHVSQTQSVYLRLQGNFLRISHTRQKIPKRAMWNEPEHKLVFTRHRIYNLLGAKVSLLPEGLAKIRHWSKKYPICIRLHTDQVNYEHPIKKVKEYKGKEAKEKKKSTVAPEINAQTQVFSKLVENAEEQEPSTASEVISVDEGDSAIVEKSDEESNKSTLTIESPETAQDALLEESNERIDLGPEENCKRILKRVVTNAMRIQEDIIENDVEESDLRIELDDEDEDSCNMMDWQTVTTTESMQASPDETRIYLFGRTGREKEDWFRRLRYASNKAVHDLTNGTTIQDEYLAFMRVHNIPFKASESKIFTEIGSENIWVNALLARILFDCAREQFTIQRIRERIQRKLASIRLPYFIEELYCEELNLGSTSPTIAGSSKPYLNDRGLWIDLDIHYEGLVILILQTKVNLLKLKHPHGSDDKLDPRSAMFHSDVDDSAESTTDEEPAKIVVPVLDARGIPVPGLGGTSNRNKKIMKMVDRIAESKFFQAATENKYIKKAMQEFSNTSLRLKVEVKKCVGTLALNIPAPPSDRIWLGFRVPPDLNISAHPIVGERNINYIRVTSWIEKKIYKEFQKIFVIPNMEDLSIPVMCTKLPE